MSSDVPASDSSASQLPSSPTPEGNLRRLAVALAPAVALLLAATLSLVAVARAGSDVPETKDWQAAATVVRAQRADGDLIVFAPGWLDPVGRQHLGDQMSIEMAARMDAAGFRRIWELGVRGERAPEGKGLPVDLTQHFGPLTLRRYLQEPAVVLYDFAAESKHAEVSGAMQGRPRLGLQEVGFEPHRCVKVVPHPDKSASMRFVDVPLGSSIVGYVGLADVFTRRDVREPGQLALFVQGKEVASVTVGVNDGWVRFSAPTQVGPADVEFQLRALGPGARDRRICFSAEARR